MGPKSRSVSHNEMLTKLLQLSKPRKATKRQPQMVLLNNTAVSSELKLVDLDLSHIQIPALVDTGSSHCLITVETFQKLKGATFETAHLNMKVAGHVLKNNIIGRTLLPVKFTTTGGSSIVILLEFLIAHVLNGYQSILGANFLMNNSMLAAITPNSLVLTKQYKSVCIPLQHQPKQQNQLNFVQVTENVRIPAHTTKPVSLKALQPIISTTVLLDSHNKARYSLSDANASSATSVAGMITNHSDDDLHFHSSDIIATVFSRPELNNTEPSVIDANADSTAKALSDDAESEEDSIDEQIIRENLLIDPTQLDKKFSYKDCEINPKLDAKIKAKLEKLLKDNKIAFATSKLDVGKFKEFSVQLEIDQEIAPEKQRQLSDEKLIFCDKTFQEFEKLGLVQECHTPRTVSNLHLVPKYDGLRDLTKASTYLAQVKGIKNTQFRIVQDLRRVNAATKNVKKTIPKLPEQILQKLRGKIVSSIDANQAYWHLQLHADSRPFTCFFLRNRIMQFNRMVQGLTSAPACWDQAMSIIFSKKTLSKLKQTLPAEEAAQLPDSFEDFFTFYQDDSWIFSDTPEQHLLHLKMVLQAYIMHDIRISPQKSTFFPDTFKILGVSFSPLEAELTLDKIKAQSILDWEKPESLFTLQSRLYALNYWQKFIPNLAELKFPLNQILRSGIFSWSQEADDAWESIKALIALDIRLTVPRKDEQLLITTDASKVACSCILWVCRDDDIRVVGCYSKLFSHADSLKNIHFKETYALVQAFQHFRPYLLNTTQPIIVFTDARSLIWVSRNREYSIACNGLVNKLAKIQLEIPHKVYSVPSEVNYLADLFSRSFTSSRFLEKERLALSKVQANKIPPLPEPCILEEAVLYQYFAQPLKPEKSDCYSRQRSKISTPKPIKSLYKLFKDCTPEQKYLSALRLLQGWDDKSLNLPDQEALETNSLNIMESKDKPLFKNFCKQVIEKIVNETMQKMYSNLDPTLTKRIRATLFENLSKIARSNLLTSLKEDFERHEEFLNSIQSVQVPDHPTVFYSLNPDSEIQPSLNHEHCSVVLPLQHDLVLQPNELAILNLGVQIFLPAPYYAVISPVPDLSDLAVYQLNAISSSGSNNTVKVTVKNTSARSLHLAAGTLAVQLLIYCKSDSLRATNGSVSGSKSRSYSSAELDLIPVQNSFLHLYIDKHSPSRVHCLELNTSIALPADPIDNYHVVNQLNNLNQKLMSSILASTIHPIKEQENCHYYVTRQLTAELASKYAELNNQLTTQSASADSDDAKQQLLTNMCQKLAVLGVDLIKNQSMTRDIFSRSQQSDDYLSTIYQSVQENTNDFPAFVIKDGVLYKRVKDSHFKVHKFVLCLPDILMPSAIHELHTTLGHPSATSTIKNFQAYYYHRHSSRLIRDYVRSCITCNYAGKYDMKKVVPSSDRTLQPTRPRQHLYCDVLPMPKTAQFSYILFCLDAYSQFIYTLPLKDKSTQSIFQAFLSLFSSTGWYECLYLDNETSFQKCGKMLVQIAPISVHYSSPYCHFQNNAENYIKSFKRCFLKMLNDSENPLPNHDWALLLPTVTQALNRRVILSLGISREALHYNSPSCYYPLAELPAQDNAEFDLLFDAIHPNIYEKIKQSRAVRLAKSKKLKVPIFHANQIVFAIDQAPASAGISSMLKLPTSGPYRIEKVDQRNVTLVDIENGKTFTSHVELIRPINLSEFKLLLSKKWQLNVQYIKAAQAARTRSNFDTAAQPIQKAVVVEQENNIPELEDEIDLEHLFYPAPHVHAPAPDSSSPAPAPGNSSPAPVPDSSSPAPAPTLHPAAHAPALSHHAPAQHNQYPDTSLLNDEFESDSSQFNSLNVGEDLSKQYKKSLGFSVPKKVTFMSKFRQLFH
jgi:RNase H-like domain found in reverse transcriptase/Reverse transcriptase (RNA-dependent DNA polymerase)/Integrase zinc binding domain